MVPAGNGIAALAVVALVACGGGAELAPQALDVVIPPAATLDFEVPTTCAVTCRPDPCVYARGDYLDPERLTLKNTCATLQRAECSVTCPPDVQVGPACIEADGARPTGVAAYYRACQK